MTHISMFVYSLIIFLSIYLVVTDGIILCKDHFDCYENIRKLRCDFDTEKPFCISLNVCQCIKQ
ncbi:putative Late nodulin [Medicago truncatula]|uniref:Nodule Cysteine-Rich (NCR) secreted peptide n=1 Tax=Medicago truncatula TaxID=3880 RepID=G7IWG0_MEDTR|nr:Nodule Cysteine-Rich (NCR) secreted peptide [Medicago truncatula]RHN66069.1 putative Late nodulin [Medicago truncatula]